MVVFKKGVFSPENKDKDVLEVMTDEWKYITEKLGIPWEEEPPSN